MSLPFRLPQSGLSPRVRGNPPWFRTSAKEAGSIPARAGEPLTARASTLAEWVYPRACGGTRVLLLRRHLHDGLSPRVRGNPFPHRADSVVTGSIPARAGEPPSTSRRLRRTGVYPRACGGTILTGANMAIATGLSPRVRGNLLVRYQSATFEGSIPARAGEPIMSTIDPSFCRVYPRACGGTAAREIGISQTAGLSPRVRGNLDHHLGRRAGDGSIPARAGEPASRQ